MNCYYEYMIWADVTETAPAQGEEPSSEVQISLFSRLVNGQRWSHVTRTKRIVTITDYITTIVGGIMPCIIIPQTGLNRKFTPEEAIELFSKAFIGKDKTICFRIPEGIIDDTPSEDETLSVFRADVVNFCDELNRNLANFSNTKDPDILYAFLTALQGHLANFLG